MTETTARPPGDVGGGERAPTATKRPVRRTRGKSATKPAASPPSAAPEVIAPRAATTAPRRTRPVKLPTPPPVIPEREPAPERLVVGRVAGAHGLRGEFRMAVITNHPEYLQKLRTVYLGDEQMPWPVRRIHPLPDGKEAIVRLAGLATAEEAAELRGQRVWSDEAALPPLPKDEYYHYQLIGLDVVTEEGVLLGRLAEIIETGANDVYIVRGLTGEVLLPAINDVIREVDLTSGTMLVSPQEYY